MGSGRRPPAVAALRQGGAPSPRPRRRRLVGEGAAIFMPSQGRVKALARGPRRADNLKRVQAGSRRPGAEVWMPKAGRRQLGSDRRWRIALRTGTSNAKLLLAERRRMIASLGARASARAGVQAPRPLIVADGDSWFDYPFFDVLDALENGFGYEVETAAHAGDTLEGLAYGPGQFKGLVRLLERLRERQRPPSAVLLSAGGNDVAGPALSALLNDHASPDPGINRSILEGVIDQRLRDALITVISTVSELCRFHFDRVPPVLIHGYDYSVPDGRGYNGGGWLLPGPWLEPHFRARGYQALAQRLQPMRILADRFNAMAGGLAGGPGLGHVTYVDLRGTLTSDTFADRYKRSWANEMHPTRAGFEAVAARFDRALRAVGAPEAAAATRGARAGGRGPADRAPRARRSRTRARAA
jgi:lysophospholipase L1-like esterase